MSHRNVTPCSLVEVLYTGDGVRFDFTFDFEYDAAEDYVVHVAIYNPNTRSYDDLTEYESGVPATDANGNVIFYYKFMNATTIRLVNSADQPLPLPNPGVDPLINATIPNLRIYRDTPLRPLDATFYPGASIRAQDLNDNFTQLRDAIEETQCEASKPPALSSLWGQPHDHTPNTEPVDGVITFGPDGTGIDQHPEGQNYVIRWPQEPPQVVNMIMAVESIVGNIIQMKWVLVTRLGGNFVIGGEFSSPNSIPDILGDGNDRFIDGGNAASADQTADSWPGTTGEPDYLDANPFPD